MYATNPFLNLNHDNSSLELSKESDFGFELLPFALILDHAERAVSNIKIFEQTKDPTISQKLDLYQLLMDFSCKFHASEIGANLSCLHSDTMQACQLTSIKTAINDFIAAPRDPKFYLKSEFYSQLADPNLLVFTPDLTGRTYIDAALLEDLLTSYLLNVDRMEPCCARDWGQPDTAYINSQEFTTYPKFQQQRAKIANLGSTEKILMAQRPLIERYCEDFGLNAQQTAFVWTHTNQNGALGLIISLFGGVFFNRREALSLSNLFMPRQTDIAFKINATRGAPLTLSANTKYVFKSWKTGEEEFFSTLRLSVEIGDTWRMISRNRKQYHIPTFATIRFEYSTPSLAMQLKYPKEYSLLLETWRFSRTRFASINELRMSESAV